MKYYRTYYVVIGVFVVIFAGIMGSIWHFSKPIEVDAVPVVADNMSPVPAAAEQTKPAKPTVKPKNAGDPVDVFLETVQAFAETESESDSEVILLTENEQNTGSYIPTAPQTVDDSSQPSPIVIVSGESSAGSSGGSLTNSSSTGGTSGSTGSSGTAAESSSDAPLSTPVTGGGVAGPVNPPSLEELSKPQNIGSVFLHREELTYRGFQLPEDTAINNLLKYDAFWAADTIAYLHPKAWRTLRTDYSEKMALRYVTLFSVRPDAPETYLDYDYIEKYHPEWFLLKDEKNASAVDYQNWDKRIRWNPDDPADWRYNRFFLDVDNTEFQDWAIKEFLKKLDPVTGINARIRYSGLAGDNGLFYAWSLAKTKFHPNWKYADETGTLWTRAYISYIKKLHNALESEGYILVVNSTVDYYDDTYRDDWNALADAVDGILKEWGVRYSTGLYDGPYWESVIGYHEKSLEKGIYDWWLFSEFSDYDNLPFTRQEHFLYEYCSYLLIKDREYSLYGIFEISQEWPEEFNLPLGDPLAPRYKQEDCWVRDYQYGKIVVNPSKQRYTMSLDSEEYMFDWRIKRTTRKLILDPCSATILLPTGFSVN